MEIQRAAPDITPHEFFTRWLGEAVQGDPVRKGKLSGTQATIEFTLTGEGGDVFTLRIADGQVVGEAGPAEEADLRVHVAFSTWRKLNAGEISAPQALLKRKLKIEGDFILGLKLHLILG